MNDIQTISLALAITGGMVLIAMPFGIWLSNSKNKYIPLIISVVMTTLAADLVFNLVKGDLLAKIGATFSFIWMCFFFIIRHKLKRARATKNGI